MKKAYIASTLFDGERFLENRAVLVEGELIRGQVAVTAIPTEYEVVDSSGGTLAPGFIDWQANGGGGVLFNNLTNENALERITQAHHQGGTTALFPTVVSDTQAKREQAVEAVRRSISDGNKSVLGIHLEGPFFSDLKRGVHRQEYLRSLSNEDIDWLCSLTELPVLLTLAPEQTAEGQIRTLTDHGIIVSAGHTNAHASEVKRALGEGLSGFTHLYNAMRAADSREPGVVGCALTDESSWCGLIADGYHVHPDMIRLAYAAKPEGKLCLVTDAMATVGSNNKSFELYGSIITERNGHLVNHEGRLAGSAISMIDAVRNCHQLVGIELAECLRMAARYPAEFLGVATELGQIKPGYRADMVLFDSDFTVLQTWVAGQAML